MARETEHRFGLLVVSHGKFSEELVRSAETVVGKVSGLAALSIGWDDDVDAATRSIEAAVGRLDRGNGVLVLTDMFGGTPTNLALSMLDAGAVEIVTGVNLPMVIKFANLRGEKDLHGVAATIAREGREAIQVASEILNAPAGAEEEGGGVSETEVKISNRLGLHARAAARFVHLANGFSSRIHVCKDGSCVDGKSILGLLTLAAGKGTRLRLTADGVDEETALGALVELVDSRFGEEA